MCRSVGGNHIVLNQEAPLHVNGSKKHFGMGERFVACSLLVPLPTISREYTLVEHNLVGVIDDLLAGV